MEQEGIVSVWAGVFETVKDLLEYACEMDAPVTFLGAVPYDGD